MFYSFSFTRIYLEPYLFSLLLIAIFSFFSGKDFPGSGSSSSAVIVLLLLLPIFPLSAVFLILTLSTIFCHFSGNPWDFIFFRKQEELFFRAKKRTRERLFPYSLFVFRPEGFNPSGSRRAAGQSAPGSGWR